MKCARGHQGFTFIELLVVVLVFTIVFTLISFSTGIFSTDKLRLNQAYYRLIGQIQLLQEKAIMRQNVYRLQYDGAFYRAQFYDLENKDWVTLEKPKTLKPSRIHDSLSFVLKNEKNQPISELNFLPNGDITPFTMEITNDNNESRRLMVNRGGLILTDEPGVNDG